MENQEPNRQEVLAEYYSGVRELIENGCIDYSGEAFAYENHRLRQFFEMYFHFGITNLARNDNKVSIEPARLFFRDRESMNGRAAKRGDYFVIGINRGVIERMYDFFRSHNAVFQQVDMESYLVLESAVPDPLGYLMFQLCTTFTFYHEKAHLLQISNSIGSFAEKYQWGENDAVYSLDGHLHEFDADLYSAHFCVMHILGYWDSLPQALKTPASLEKLMVCAVSAIFCYWLFLAEESDEFYFRAYEHPHPVVRVCYLVTALYQTLEANDKPISLPESETIVRSAIDLTNRMFQMDDEHKVEAFAEIFMEEGDAIEAYINELLDEARKRPNLTINF